MVDYNFIFLTPKFLFYYPYRDVENKELRSYKTEDKHSAYTFLLELRGFFEERPIDDWKILAYVQVLPIVRLQQHSLEGYRVCFIKTPRQNSLVCENSDINQIWSF